jgi:hypothetical protein
MELTTVNLSRSRKLWPRTANLRRECPVTGLSSEIFALILSMSSSVEIVKTWLGFPYTHLPNFSDICPRPLHTYMPHKTFPRKP